MDDSQHNIIRLQDLILGDLDSQCEKFSAASDTALQKVHDEFAPIESEVSAFFAKVFPQGVDVICSLNEHISRRERTLYFKGKIVPGTVLSCDNCLSVCHEALASFPSTIDAMVSALKNRRNAECLEKLSQKLCREFNTISTFQANIKRFKSECIAAINAKRESDAKRTDVDNFSELVTIPIGKVDAQAVTIDLNVLRPDAHAVIAGISGSGKSSLLQSLILSGAYKYSPDKLQFWILDFKEGTGLIQFKALKHVRVMSVKNRAVDTVEIMNLIKNEYNRRAAMIADCGGGDIREYNQWAKTENKPLMPRLLIIIDEFVIMHRSGFTVLNEMARVGRSMGMGFILSSQIIETGAAYGEAVQQANHLFEFKNHDSLFGRLVKNVSEEERRFACSGVVGNCIYRRDNVRTAFRVAYAGAVSEQNALIKKINDKWNDFTYIKPIITGRPERKIKCASSLICDGKKIKETFSRTKKVFVPIGESRMGEPYLYKIDRENQLLLAFGDETRVASIEYSVIENFRHFSESEKAVYYVDLNCNPDRQINAVTAKYDGDRDGVSYVATDDDAKTVIDRVYKVLKSRRNLARTGRTKDIGNPIELIIHNAERIIELKDEKRSPVIGGIARNKPVQKIESDDMDLESFLATKTKTIVVEPEEDDIGTVKKLCEIIEKGKNSRIFVMLYFEERSRFQSIASDIFGYNCDFKDVIVVPKIPDEYEELSYNEVVDTLVACKLREQANIFDQTKLEQSDFICAVLVDDKVSRKIIPYEWEAE